METTRRKILQAMPFFGAAAAVGVAPLVIEHKPTPDERIEAAMAEIKAAMAEKYPGWRVSGRNDEVRPVTFRGGERVELDPSRHCVLIFASTEKYGPESAGWFVKDGPLLAEDVNA